MSKRTLIAETPNVLIVHLQRIVFNFDTFQNDKLNQHFEFPRQLDLRPYSYYDVMGRENRLKKPKAAGDDGADENLDAGLDGTLGGLQSVAEGEAKAEGGEDDVEPAVEECFEYQLAGVTVHSGNAHAGHYWAYINTKRGQDGPPEGADDAAWASPENARWLEFNDSTVREFSQSKLNEECFGGDGHSSGGFGLSSIDGWGLGGGGYGKSGYMLFYERRQKKPIQLLKDTEDRGAVEVNFQEAVAPGDKPNKIFQKVLQDNRKFAFENDIYSEAFYDFVLGLQKTVIGLEGSCDEVVALRNHCAEAGSKLTLEILARAYHNTCIGDHVKVLVDLMHRDASDQLPRKFLASWSERDGFDYLFSLLLENPDALSRGHTASLLKFVLVSLKMQEKDYLYEAEDYEVVGDDGKSMTMQRHKALSARFITRAMELLNTQVAKNWQRFDQFHDLLYTFALADVSDVYPLSGNQTEMKTQAQQKLFDTTTPAARVGLEFFFKAKYVEKACDFMLGKKSPLCRPGERRTDLGGPYTHPELGNVIKLMCAMITDDELLAQHPMQDIEKEMILHQDLLKTLLGSVSAGKQFGRCLANMCRDNRKLSKKVTKVFLRSIE